MSKLKNSSVHKSTKDNKGAECDLVGIEEKREERRLRYWVVKVLVLTLSFLSVLTVLTFLYLLVINKTPIKEGAIGSFLQVLTEIIKFMLTPTP
jgi:hypothetical protein